MKRVEDPGIIEHDGIVRKVENNSVFVAISLTSACSGCHAEGFCNISGKEEKIVDIQGRYNVAPGDNVTILMTRSMGYRAIVLSYLVPLIIVILSLSILISLSVTELISGLVSIGILIPYFTILYLFRKQINKRFTFTLKLN